MRAIQQTRRGSAGDNLYTLPDGEESQSGMDLEGLDELYLRYATDDNAEDKEMVRLREARTKTAACDNLEKVPQER